MKPLKEKTVEEFVTRLTNLSWIFYLNKYRVIHID
jgi:hypothetical protein